MSTRTPTRRRATALLLTALASALAGIGCIEAGLVGVSDAAYFGAGGALALVILAGGSGRHPDALYPARMQLARFRRSGHPADILLVELPATTSMTGRRLTRRCASAVSSVLRVTDGVSMVRSGDKERLCAVVDSDGRARAAIDQRLKRACGDEVRVAWASSPGDGVTLESLLEVALSRLPLSDPGGRRRRHSLLPLPAQRLLPHSLGPDREPMRSAR